LRSYCTAEPAAIVEDIATLKADKYDRSNDLLIEGSIEQISVEISTENFHK
jgi:hypothetical protein